MHRHSLRGLLLVLCAVFPAFADDPAADFKLLNKDAQAAFQAKDWKKCAELFRKICELKPDDGAAWHNLGYALHSQGLLDDALAAHMKSAALKSRHQAAGAYNCACVYALKGDKDRAFEWLDKAVTLGFGQTDLLDTDTDLESLRGDARLGALRERAATNGAAQAFANSSDRRSTRVAWFTNAGGAGQVVIDYGPVPWAGKYQDALTSGKLDGQRWRFGKDYWTTLDNSVPLSFGDAQIPVGHWYLVAAKTGDAFELFALDSAAIRAQKLDAFQAAQTKGGIAVKLSHEETKSVSADLHVEITSNPENDRTGELVIEFGPHRLSAPWSTKL